MMGFMIAESREIRERKSERFHVYCEMNFRNIFEKRCFLVGEIANETTTVEELQVTES